MVRAGIAARISRVNALAVDRQIEDGQAYFATKGVTVAPENIFVDDGISASAFSKKKRPDYLRLLAKIEAGELDELWMWAEDRTHRQILELAEFIRLCREHNVKVATAGTEYDLSDPDQVTMWYIKVRFAEAEVEKTSRRLRRQRLQAAQQGAANGGGKRPFGFTGTGKHKVTLARALSEQECIREAAQRILAGDSLRGIVVDWNKRAIKTTTGGQWSNRSLRQMLMSPRIAGYRSHLGKLHKAAWSEVIPPEQWREVKAVLEDPARKTTVGGGLARYLLTGLVFCGVCGARMRGRAGRGGRGAVYVCQRQFRGAKAEGECVQRSARPVEELICGALFEAVASPTFDQVREQRARRDPAAEVVEQLARDQGLLDRLEDKVAMELISEPAARRNRAQIEQRMERARKRLGQLQSGRVAAAVPRNLPDVWPSLSLDRRRAILATVIERVEIGPQLRGRTFDPDAIKVTWRA
jgi:site-specific DNA recombinase